MQSQRREQEAGRGRAETSWVQALWASRTGLGRRALPVIGHRYTHLGEARVARARLEQAAR